ncbi:MAG TPA: ABC transporter ATP-binding protein [Streptosporangiaceae bacterium]|nr:ABC transporter ATP-binding protein [Streptosporangiaceae bacterium]
MTDTATTQASPATGVPVLEARNLTKLFPVRSGFRRRGAVHAVENVSLTLARSAVTAVVGESGSGKSTLARMLARIITPTSGELLLDGQPVPLGQRGRRRYAARVQLVLQDPFASLNPVHSVRYHLARPLRIHRTAGGDIDEAIAGLLRRVSLDPPAQFTGKLPHELSGGQRQRVAIARALAAQPDVLLADEPVSMLDVSIRLGVLNLLGSLRDSSRLTILYVTHDIASARYLADTIAVMYAGEIIESAPGTELTDAPAHPYTQLLLSAAPDPARGAPPSLAGRGAPPSLVSPPPGCRFHPRCPHAMRVCEEQAPPSVDVAAGHAAACWLHVRDLSAAQSRPAGTRRARSRPVRAPSGSAPEPGKEAG